MKITPEQLAALQREAQKQKSSRAESFEDFQKMLEQEVDKSQGPISTSAGEQTGKAPHLDMNSLHALMQTSATSSVLEQQTSGQQIMEQVDALLNKWENYAQQLQKPEEGLKQSYQTLEEINSAVKMLQDNMPESGKQSEQLQPLLNELEIMAVTEKIKFNRGDYTG
jgi:uncharacterized protein YoxC